MEESIGLDVVMPSDSLFTTRLDEFVKLRLGEVDSVKYPPISIYSMLDKTVNSRPNYPALVQKDNVLTYLEYWTEIHKVAKSFLKVNACLFVLERFDFPI